VVLFGLCDITVAVLYIAMRSLALATVKKGPRRAVP